MKNNGKISMFDSRVSDLRYHLTHLHPSTWAKSILVFLSCVAMDAMLGIYARFQFDNYVLYGRFLDRFGCEYQMTGIRKQFRLYDADVWEWSVAELKKFTNEKRSMAVWLSCFSLVAGILIGVVFSKIS